VATNEGFVSVGSDHDTAAFAVETIRRWHATMGRLTYREATRLLICADGGGSNGSHNRAWKTELATLAADTGLEITVCHLPPGTSKWSRIEHRLFSHISMNWRGRPLVSYDPIVQLIGATTTHSGLKVHAERDFGLYPTKTRVSDEDLEAIPPVPPCLPRRMELHRAARMIETADPAIVHNYVITAEGRLIL